MMLEEIIAARLQAALKLESCEVIDESALHAGHVGAKPEGNTHFRIKITSAELSAQTRIAAHKQIYALLTDLMNHPIHALAIEIKRSG